MMNTLHNMFSKTQISALIVSVGGFTLSEIEIYVGYTELVIKLVTLATAIVVFYQVITKKNKAMNKFYKDPNGDDEDGTEGEDEDKLPNG